MFCPKCGNQLADGAKFCNACGNKLEEQNAEKVIGNQYEQPTTSQNDTLNDGSSANQYQTSGQSAQQAGGQSNDWYGAGAQSAASYTAPENSQDNKNKFIGIGVVAVLVIAVIAVIGFVGSLFFGGKYDSQIKDTAKLINKRETNVDKYVEAALPGFASDFYKDIKKIAKKEDKEAYESSMDLSVMAIEGVYEVLEAGLGEDFKIKTKFENKESLDKEEREDIYDNYEFIVEGCEEAVDEWDKVEEMAEESMDSSDVEFDHMDDVLKSMKKLVKEISKIDKIDKGYKTDVIFTLESDRLEDPIEVELEMVFIKVGGDWMIDFVSLAEWLEENGDDLAEDIMNSVDEEEMMEIAEDMEKAAEDLAEDIEKEAMDIMEDLGLDEVL